MLRAVSGTSLAPSGILTPHAHLNSLIRSLTVA
jgi:hypothetical protein